MSAIRVVAALLALTAAGNAAAGPFVFAGSGNNQNFITHPQAYTGAGGVATATVCLKPTTVLPAGVTLTQAENTIKKAVKTWNAQRAATQNLALTPTANDIGASQADWESVLLHEMGHCVGLAHPNLATESGLGDPTANGTKADTGTNGVFNVATGADANFGSRDDVRVDDVNLYWFGSGSNDPLYYPAVIDTTTFTRTGAYPTGHLFAANGDRTVLAALGYSSTESVMQQGQFFDEAQRRLTSEDLATLKLAMAGLDGVQGTGDDYTLAFSYVGQVASCNLTIEFLASTSFAVCQTGGGSIGNHVFVTSAALSFNNTTNWYLSQTENTTTTITARNPTSNSVGGSSIVSASVSASALIGGTPTGSVLISDGTASCTGTLSGGATSCTLTFASSGTKTLTADYLGFQGYDASTSAGVTHVVSKANPSITAPSESADPTVAGTAYTVGATVSGTAGTPTGTVTFSDGAATCTGTLSGGAGSCSLTSTTAGAKSLTATYNGNTTYNTVTSAVSAHTVNKATPTVTINSDTPDPTLVGGAYTVTVTVAGVANVTTPTGNVTVGDGAATCTVTLASGTGSCNLTSSTAGAKSISAAYNGDTNYNIASATSAAHTVNKAASTVAITSDTPDPSAVGQAYAVAVSVTGVAGGATPSGTVTVGEGVATCTVTLVSGSGSCNLTSATTGVKSLSAAYNGDANYGTSSAASASHTVSLAIATVVITADTPDPSNVGQAYAVTVSVTGSSGTPTGSVTVSDGTSTCTIALATATSCNLTSTTAGAKSLIATYGGDTTYGSATSVAVAHTVSKATPTVTITSDTPDPSVVGGAYAIAVSVTGAGVTPTGTVSVSDGAATCTATLASGAGTCNLTSSTGGVKSITAAYNSDANYTAANATAASHTVDKANSTVAITSDTPDPSTVGQAYAVSVSVTGVAGGATPAGTVTVGDGTATCTVTLASGAGTCSLTSSTAGTKSLSAAYNGDTSYNTSSAVAAAHVVGKANATVAITGDTPDPSTVGQTYAVSAAVTGVAGGATPGGSVTIGDGVSTCTITLTSGAGSCNLPSNTAGTKTLSAAYLGDANYNTASATTVSHVVNVGVATVAITSDTPDPSTVGQSYTVAVSVTGGGATPGGTVAISDGAGANCNATLTAGAGSCSLASNTVGTKTLAANYGGDANYGSASAATVQHVVDKAAPTVAITADTPDPTQVGAPYTVSVSVSGGGATPTGSVTIGEGSASCTASLSAGAMSCQLSSATAGTRTLTANYAGDANYLAASAPTSTHTVSKVTPTVTITSDTPDPSTYGQSYVVSVSVVAASSAPTGDVTIGDGTNSCVATLAPPNASCSLPSTSVGTKTLSASYAGDANHDAAIAATVSHAIDKAQPTVAIGTRIPAATVVGQSYAVTVSAQSAVGTPTGTIVVGDGVASCNVTLINGIGSCNLVSTTAGTKTISAVYSGDANYETQAAPTASHVVSKGAPTVTITADTPDPSAAGESYDVGVSVTGAGVLPGGSVTIDNGGANCIVTLNAGSGTCALVSNAAGPVTLTASYGGDANYLTASDTETHTVSKIASTVTITSDDPDPSGLTEAYTVAVSVTGDAGTPTGTVQVSDGAAACTITLSGGIGSCQLASTSAGSRTLTATYGGDANFGGDTDTESHTVAKGDSTITILDVADATVGTPYLVSVSVDAAIAAMGTVTIGDGAASCTATLSGGTAACSLTSANAGERIVTANYAGNADLLASSVQLAVEVAKATTTVSITSVAPSTSVAGQSYLVSISVATSFATATGAVTIGDGTASCNATLDAAGNGACSLTTNAPGIVTLTATYGGDANHLGSADTEPHTVSVASDPLFKNGFE